MGKRTTSVCDSLIKSVFVQGSEGQLWQKGSLGQMTERMTGIILSNYCILMTRTDVQGGDGSLEYENGGENDDNDVRKEHYDSNAKEDIKFTLPQTMTLNISRAMFFEAN